MNHDDEVKLSRDEYEFRVHMIKFSGRVDESLETLKKESSNQFERIEKLEAAPRKTTAVASAIATAISGAIIALVEMFRR